MRSLSLGALSGVPFFILVCSIFSGSVFADEYFDTKRYSPLTPSHCQEFKLNYFNGPLRWVTYSVHGATKNGFTHGVDLSRHEAAQAWRYLRTHFYKGPDPRWPFSQTERGNALLTQLEKARTFWGFTYGSEGEILEAISLIDLSKYFDPKEYFFTGGIEYHHASGSILGELDIIVARRDNCEVVVVGESKLGLHRLKKAQDQLARFRHFVIRAARLSGKY